MKNSISVLILLLISFNGSAFAQSSLNEDTTVVASEKILRSYITAGYGRSINNDTWSVGVGWFLPLSDNLLIGPRANGNFELDVFSKTPAENIWDVEVELRYIPFITDRFFISTGAGIGYSRATKRGEFIGYNLFTAEYEKVYSSSVCFIGEIEGNLLITNNFGINLTVYSLFADNKTYLNYQFGLFLCKIMGL